MRVCIRDKSRTRRWRPLHRKKFVIAIRVVPVGNVLPTLRHVTQRYVVATTK